MESKLAKHISLQNCPVAVLGRRRCRLVPYIFKKENGAAL